MTADQWVDPRPKWPPSGTRCVVRCSDGTIRQATAEGTWDGWRWKDVRTGFWSMAHPQVIGWKRWGDATDEEQKESKKYGY